MKVQNLSLNELYLSSRYVKSTLENLLKILCCSILVRVYLTYFEDDFFFRFKNLNIE